MTEYTVQKYEPKKLESSLPVSVETGEEEWFKNPIITVIFWVLESLDLSIFLLLCF